MIYNTSLDSIFRFIALLAITLWCNISFSQSVTFEELSPFNHTEVNDIYRSPNNDIYVISNFFKVLKSTDNGISWNEVKGLPQPNSSFFRMQFLENGDEIFQISVLGGYSYYMRKNGTYENIIPDSLAIRYSNSDVNVFGNTISFYQDGKLYQTEDKGETFSVYDDERLNQDDQQLFLTDENIYVRKSGGSNNTLDLYDRDFKFLFSSDVWMTLYSDIYSDKHGNLIHTYASSGKILYSGNKGQSFIKKDIPGGFNGFSILVKDAYCYLLESSSNSESSKVRRIRMDENFEDNPIELVAEFPITALIRRGDHGFGFTIYDNDQFTIHNFISGDKLTIPFIDFPSSIVKDIYVDSDGGIVAGSGNVFLKSTDDGQNWSRFHTAPFAYNLSHLENGGFVYSSASSIVEVDGNGQASFWDIPSSARWNLKPFSVNNGQYRIVINCFSREFYVSFEGGPFRKIFADSEFNLVPTDGLSLSHEAKLVGDDIIIYNRARISIESINNSGFLSLVTIDTKDDFKANFENRVNQIQDVSTTKFGLIVNEAGSLFAHPLDGGPDSGLFQSSWYAQEADAVFGPSGGGPQGKLYFNEENELLVLVSDKKELHFKKGFDSNFKEATIEGKDFEEIYAAAFDNQGRLVISVDCGRVLRLDLNNLSVSTENKKEEEFKIFPNPTSDFLNVSFPETTFGSYSIYNLSGIKIKEATYNSGQLNIDVSLLNDGLYIIQIEDDQKNMSLKQFVKF